MGDEEGFAQPQQLLHHAEQIGAAAAGRIAHFHALKGGEHGFRVGQLARVTFIHEASYGGVNFGRGRVRSLTSLKRERRWFGRLRWRFRLVWEHCLRWRFRLVWEHCLRWRFRLVWGDYFR